MTEAEIRRAVVAQLVESPTGQGAAFISEMFLDNFSRRADLVMANGKLCAFEIKSALDSLDRLDGQLESYVRFFEQVTVVCAAKHLAGVIDRSHESVGVWSVSKEGCISVIRKAKTQPVLAKRAWLSFLPVDELRLYLRHCEVQATGARDDLVAAAETTALTSMRDYVLAYLKRRELRIEQRTAARAKRRSDAVSTAPAKAPHASRLDAFLRKHLEDGAVVATPRLVRQS